MADSFERWELTDCGKHMATIEKRPFFQIWIDCRENFGDPAPIAKLILDSHNSRPAAEAMAEALELCSGCLHGWMMLHGDSGEKDPDSKKALEMAESSLEAWKEANAR
jgi:hypothetical protein